jgi:hypothetical protein
MYICNASKFIFTFIVLCNITFYGEAFASPKSSELYINHDRIEYATSLNSIASTIMSWYGSLLTSNKQQSRNKNFNNTKIRFSLNDQLWEEYRSTYPEKITSIKISNADLKKQDISGQYQFEVEVLLTFMQENKKQNKIINELFLFQISDSNKPKLLMITRHPPKVDNSKAGSASASEFQYEYYKSREFAYAWLAYLDGANTMGTKIDIEHWLNTANYSVKIGGFKLNEKLFYSLQKRSRHMGKGGHLLRSVTTKVLEEKPDHYELNLIIDWKGLTPSGELALAKINQIILFKLQEDGSLIVISINEKHLLPDMEPWQKLLC